MTPIPPRPPSAPSGPQPVIPRGGGAAPPQPVRAPPQIPATARPVQASDLLFQGASDALKDLARIADRSPNISYPDITFGNNIRLSPSERALLNDFKSGHIWLSIDPITQDLRATSGLRPSNASGSFVVNPAWPSSISTFEGHMAASLRTNQTIDNRVRNNEPGAVEEAVHAGRFNGLVNHGNFYNIYRNLVELRAAGYTPQQIKAGMLQTTSTWGVDHTRLVSNIAVCEVLDLYFQHDARTPEAFLNSAYTRAIQRLNSQNTSALEVDLRTRLNPPTTGGQAPAPSTAQPVNPQRAQQITTNIVTQAGTGRGFGDFSLTIFRLQREGFSSEQIINILENLPTNPNPEGSSNLTADETLLIQRCRLCQLRIAARPIVEELLTNNNYEQGLVKYNEAYRHAHSELVLEAFDQQGVLPEEGIRRSGEIAKTLDLNAANEELERLRENTTANMERITELQREINRIKNQNESDELARKMLAAQLPSIRRVVATAVGTVGAATLLGGLIAHYKGKAAYLETERMKAIVEAGKTHPGDLPYAVAFAEQKLADPEIQAAAEEVGRAAAYSGVATGLIIGSVGAAPALYMRFLLAEGRVSPGAIRFAGRIGLIAAPVLTGIMTSISSYKIETNPATRSLSKADKRYLHIKGWTGGLFALGAGTIYGTLGNLGGPVGGFLLGSGAAIEGAGIGEKLVDEVAPNRLAREARLIAAAREPTFKEKADQLSYEAEQSARQVEAWRPWPFNNKQIKPNEKEIAAAAQVERNKVAQLGRELLALIQLAPQIAQPVKNEKSSDKT